MWPQSPPHPPNSNNCDQERGCDSEEGVLEEQGETRNSYGQKGKKELVPGILEASEGQEEIFNGAIGLGGWQGGAWILGREGRECGLAWL